MDPDALKPSPGELLPAPTSNLTIHMAGRTLHISRFAFLLGMGVLVGAVTGLVAVLFRLAGIYGQALLFPYVKPPGQFLPTRPWALIRVVTPILGGLISGLVLFRFGRYQRAHGIPEILRSVALGQSHFEAKMLIPPALATVTLATGGSVGPEGPIAEIGAVTGSLFGRWVKLPPKIIKTLIGAGVAAGIAGVFNAPIAGVFFAIEVILRDYEIASFTPIAIASVVATVVGQNLLGDKMAIQIPEFHIPPRELPWFILLGLLCGGISWVYIKGLTHSARLMKRAPGPLWLRPALGGLLVGLIGLFFPNVMGEGYDWIRQVIMGQYPMLLLAALALVKIAATGITLGSSNPGGSFAPAVFIGVMGGAALGHGLSDLGWVASPMPYAVMGMAGLIAGALGAPLTAIMIALRHTQYMSDMLLPAMLTVAMSAVVMQYKRNLSVYTSEFLSRGIDLDQARRRDPLSLVRVEAVMRRKGFEELDEGLSIGQALERAKRSSARWFIVRGAGGGFAGIVSLYEMRLAIAEEELASMMHVSEVTDRLLPQLEPAMSLKEALRVFNQTEAEALPVVRGQDEEQFMGVLTRQDALNAWCEVTEMV